MFLVHIPTLEGRRVSNYILSIRNGNALTISANYTKHVFYLKNKLEYPVKASIIKLQMQFIGIPTFYFLYINQIIDLTIYRL